MADVYSSLVTYKNVTSHKSVRTAKIDTITIHHAAGVGFTAKQGCDYFAYTTKQASSNYYIGNDGSIGLSVPENYRAWTSSNRANDNRAITIEVANSKGDPNWEISDVAMASLIKLVADVCKRNGIAKLLWKNDKRLIGQVTKQNMTLHQWFAATGCPGPYLTSKMGYIADEVNKVLNGGEGGGGGDTPSTVTFSKGDWVTVKAGAVYYGTKTAVPTFVLKETWIVESVSGSRVVINKSTDGKYAIMSPIDAKYLNKVKSTDTTKVYYPGEFPTLPAKGYLGYGDKGSEVKDLQNFLNWYRPSFKLAVDGIFGFGTKGAVVEFQKAQSLYPDGLFGAKSLAAAKAYYK